MIKKGPFCSWKSPSIARPLKESLGPSLYFGVKLFWGEIYSKFNKMIGEIKYKENIFYQFYLVFIVKMKTRLVKLCRSEYLEKMCPTIFAFIHSGSDSNSDQDVFSRCLQLGVGR